MRPGPLFFRALFWLVVAAIALFLLLPTLVIVPISFTAESTIRFPPQGFSLQWYQNVVTSPAWRAATLTSLETALGTAVLSMVLGTAAALFLARVPFRGKAIVRGILLSPLVTPVIVLAVGIYLVFARWGLSGTLASLILAHTVLALPFVLVSVTASLQSVNPNLELAGLGLGASRAYTFRRVLLPLIAPGVASGGIFAFITSWDEVVVAIFLTDPGLRTVPVLIWSQLRAELDPTMAAVGTILIAVSALGLGAITLLKTRNS
ncbi:ABC transporter permease [Pseudoxanthobacter sp.]|uniref:ABC transporter permease n=1 Tax=Pseudoxanthobacter sp. TaxID=1925742 RepID=UPI002FE00DE5